MLSRKFGRTWLFSSLRLVRRTFIAYWMAMVLMAMNVFLICSREILKLSSRLVIEGLKVVALAPATITIRGSIFHPSVLMSLISGWYFSILMSMASCENLSLPYLNSINWIVRLGSMWFGGGALYGRPLRKECRI